MDSQITALYRLAQQLDRQEFLAALELAAEQQTIGAEYVSALAALPRPRPACPVPDGELRIRLAEVLPQRAIERDLAQYEQYVANRDLTGSAAVGGAA